MPEKKSKPIVYALIGAGAVLLGGVAAYLYSDGYIGASDTPIESAKVVPNQALMAGTISTDPRNWAQLQQFGTPEVQKLVDKGLKDFQKDAFADSKINYDKDVRPWLGSVMFAMLPSSGAKATQEPDVLVVVGIKNKFSMLGFGNKFKNDKTKGATKETDYKGVKIYENTDNGKKTYAAILKNHLVMASEIKNVQQAIDTFKGQPSLASKADASAMFSKGVDVKNPIAQFYVPDYGAFVEQLVANNAGGAGVSPQALKQMKAVKSMVAGVGIDEAGVRFKAVTKIDPAAMKFEYKPSPGKVIGQLPASAIATINGQGISRFWSVIVEEGKNDPQIKQAIEGARQQVKTVNLDLDKDILGWMDGEFAIAAIPSNEGILKASGFGGALVFETSDRATAEATLTKLDAIAKGNSMTVSQRDVGGKKVTEWVIPQQGAFMGHGWLDQNTVFVAIGGPIADAIATKPSPLDSSESFKAVTGTLPQTNAGYFYLDMDKTMSVINSQLPPEQKSAITPETSAVINSIRGLAIAVTQPDKSTSGMEMLLALKPKTAK
jgi:hypothetical protein